MEAFKCEFCGKEFRNKAGLGGHQAALHGIRKPKAAKLREVISAGLAGLEHHLAGLEHHLAAVEGRVKGLEGRQLPEVADPGPGLDNIERQVRILFPRLSVLDRKVTALAVRLSGHLPCQKPCHLPGSMPTTYEVEYRDNHAYCRACGDHVK